MPKQVFSRATEWIARLTAAGILIQTLFFKFTGAAESVHIFQSLGLEPWGRLGSGIVELIAAILLVLPARRLAALGALLALGTISGAIFFHLTKLGIEVQGDGGALFVMALVVFGAAAYVLQRNIRSLLTNSRTTSDAPTPSRIDSST